MIDVIANIVAITVIMMVAIFCVCYATVVVVELWGDIWRWYR